MTIGITDLIKLITKEQAKATLLDLWKALELPVTAWQSGGIALELHDSIADLYTDCRTSIQQIALGGYLDDAKGPWLTLLAKGFFGLDRKPAIFTEGTPVLSCAPGAGPHTIAVGQLLASNNAGKFYVNTTGGVLGAGPSTLSLSWKAQSPGAAYNIAIGTLTKLHTGLTGVSINNPDIGGGTWRTVEGVDEESDPALRERCRLRWASLAIQAPADAYKFWALTASNSVTRVYVDDQNPDGPGSFRVYLAGPSGPVAAGIVNTVHTYLMARRGVSSILNTLSATGLPVSVAGTVYAPASLGLTIGDVNAAVEAYFRELAIGGDRIAALPTQRLFLDPIEQSIKALGAKVVNLTSPANDSTAVATNEVIVPTLGLSLVTY
jgi:uncharacterized phage protein gp47/JayE